MPLMTTPRAGTSKPKPPTGPGAASGGRALPGGRAPGAGPVAAAARVALANLDSVHSAPGLLIAVAERLAEDIDDATEVRDRVAAARALLDVVAALDATPPPPTGGAPEESRPDGDGGAGDNPFGIPDVVPSNVRDGA
jgi:hypothetical protein